MQRPDRNAIPGRLALLAAVGGVLVVDIAIVPVLLQETARDWNAYAGAGRALATGAPLYPWSIGGDIRAPAPYPYLYPPPLAAIWTLGFTPALLLGLKLVSLAAVYPLARRVGASVIGSLAVAGLALAAPPVIHDLILGNVMTLYLAAVCLAVVFPGWTGAIALGVICAVALKPAIGPFLLFLLLRRRDDFLRTLAVGGLVTLMFAAAIGPGRYAEYLAALPALSGLAAPFTGNVGLSAISPWAGVASVVVAYAFTLASVRLDERSAVSVAIACCVVAQPTLGLNYAALLIPAVVLLWPVSRRLALVSAVVGPAAAVVSTVATTFTLAAAALLTAVLSRDRQPRADSGAAITAVVRG